MTLLLRKSGSALLPPKRRAYLDSLVVTSAESWFAASQSQASACAASPPSCSLMHLRESSAKVGAFAAQPFSPCLATAASTKAALRRIIPKEQLGISWLGRKRRLSVISKLL